MKNPNKAENIKLAPGPKLGIEITYVGVGAAGHDITLTVKAGDNERISRVKTVLDSLTIGNDFLSPPNSWYRREFFEVGSYSPGKTHKVIVEATSTTGSENASLIWTDRGGKLKSKKVKK